jgi:glycosyltransferase involved in cell wall biosynthesis
MSYIPSMQTAKRESRDNAGNNFGSCGLRGKRVAMVTFSPYPGDPRPRRAIDAFVQEGMTVDLVCLGDGVSPRREKLESVNVTRIPIKNRRGGKLAYAWQYFAFILTAGAIFALRSLAHRYDLVYVHNMPDILVLSSLVPKALGAKVILDLHDPMPELMTTIFNLDKDSSSVRLITRLEKWSIARADFVLTVNVTCKRIFSSRSCGPEKIGVVMNSPDGAIFPFHAPEAHAANGGSQGNAFVIMYHGSLVERNGLELAVEALARARKGVPNVELRVYGQKTPFLERVMEAARQKGVQEAIHYLGPKRLEELVPEIAACDIGIIPNQRNAFTEINTPTRIFEYLSLGKPVIAPNTQGIRDYFGKESLVFFEPGNPENLADKIEYAFSHRAEVTEMTKQGQKVYREHSWTNERSRLVRFVAGLLGEGLGTVDCATHASRSVRSAAVPASRLD